MNTLYFVLQGVVPVFLLIAIGWFLKRKAIINDSFIKASSQVGFRLGIPSLVFLKIAPLDFKQVFDIREVSIICGVSFFFFVMSLLLSAPMRNQKQRASLTQGAFRGNVAILGLALILSLYGEEMGARAAMISAFIVPLFNILAVISLTVPGHGFSSKGLLLSLKSIAKNPIIWGVVLGIIVSLLGVDLPIILAKLLGYLADLALPLTLINIGGTLRAEGFKEKGKLALISSSVKVILNPLVGCIIFYMLGYRGSDLGLVYLILGAPTAVASHAMADAMDADGELAGLIVMISTIMVAPLTIIMITLIQTFT